MINLKIDPEFQSQIPPLTDDEFKQLEENILKEGKLLSPLIVWNNTLVDGHNRYAILQKHPEIYFSTMPLPFESREEVLAWICKNQLGRRNLTPEQKKYLVGKQYEAEKRSHGANDGFRGNQHELVSAGKRHLPTGTQTCKRIAKDNGVGKTYVKDAELYAKGVDAAEEAVPGTRQKVLSGEVKPTAAEIASVARAPPEERPALVEKICTPKKPKKSTNKSTSKAKKEKAENAAADDVAEPSCKSETAPAGIDDPPKPTKTLTELQTIRALSDKMESVEQVADAEGMLSEVASAADTMIYRLDVCFEHYPEFLENPNIRQRVVELLQKAKEYIVKLEGEFAYD